MNYVVISDTHGKWRHLVPIINDMKKTYGVNGLIHLGDYTKDIKALAKAVSLPYYYVAGNGDLFETKTQEIIEMKDHRLLLVHGHEYFVHYDLQRLFYRAEEYHADAVLFGHTHRPLNEEIDGILFFNPGSPSRPRDAHRGSTIGLLSIDDKEIHTEILRI